MKILGAFVGTFVVGIFALAAINTIWPPEEARRLHSVHQEWKEQGDREFKYQYLYESGY